MPTPFGKYTLLHKLGEGGMAEVFLARQDGAAGFQKLVVVKRILPHLTHEAEFVRMFVNEARIVVRLSHENIAQVYDLGRVGDSYFIAMEWVNGEDLAETAREWGKRGVGPLPPGVILRNVIELCAGLHYAHDATDPLGKPLGLVHRDVSPQNVLSTYEGQVKIIDFGVAKATALASETRAGQMRGKYAYMAPEQCRGEPIDRRADVFAAGVVLWEMMAWRRLFKREQEYLTMRAVVTEEAPRLSSVRSGSPAALDRVLERALAKNRNERYPSCEALGEELVRVARGERWDVTSRGLATFMQDLFADKLTAQRDQMREAAATTVEQFLMKVDEGTKIDWIGHVDGSDEGGVVKSEMDVRDAVTAPIRKGGTGSTPSSTGN